MIGRVGPTGAMPYGKHVTVHCDQATALQTRVDRPPREADREQLSAPDDAALARREVGDGDLHAGWARSTVHHTVKLARLSNSPPGTLTKVNSERDLFANFERMRREIDELFGDVFERTGIRGRGFSPSVDVYYTDDPPRAVVKADLAGVRSRTWRLRSAAASC